MLQQVIVGLSTSQISRALFISSNTVQDHLKAIFAKTGVHSRRELVAQIFTHQYMPRIWSEARLGSDGWFAGAGVSADQAQQHPPRGPVLDMNDQ